MRRFQPAAVSGPGSSWSDFRRVRTNAPGRANMTADDETPLGWRSQPAAATRHGFVLPATESSLMTRLLELWARWSTYVHCRRHSPMNALSRISPCCAQHTSGLSRPARVGEHQPEALAALAILGTFWVYVTASNVLYATGMQAAFPHVRGITSRVGHAYCNTCFSFLPGHLRTRVAAHRLAAHVARAAAQIGLGLLFSILASPAMIAAEFMLAKWKTGSTRALHAARVSAGPSRPCGSPVPPPSCCLRFGWRCSPALRCTIDSASRN